MERSQGQADPVGGAADLVECEKPVEAVERGILEPLRHDRAAVLLQFLGEAHDGIAAVAAARPGDQLGRGKGVQEIEDARIDVGFVSARLAYGPVEIAAIGVGGRGRAVYIGAINREAGNHLFDRPLQDVLREIRAAGFAGRRARRRGRGRSVRSPSRSP